MKLNNVKRYTDTVNCPWQVPALALLDKFFPNWKTATDAELLNIENNNPRTMARFDTLWQGIPIFFNQRDNYTMPDRTCNSTANAMYLLSFRPWLLWNDGDSNSTNNDNEFLRRVLSYGDTIYHENQTKALAFYGLKTRWNTNKDERVLRQLCTGRIPSTVNILHRGSAPNYRGGHIITVYGFDDVTKEYLYHDPYGSIKTNYQRGSNGRNNRMAQSEFMARWQGGYRTVI